MSTTLTTVVQLELWHILVAVASFAATFASGIFLFGKFIMRQLDARLDDRFSAQEQVRTEASEHWQQRFEKLEQEDREHRDQLQQFRLKVSEEYWRREDAIRQEVVLHAKIDALAAKIDNLALRALRLPTESER